MTRGSIALLLHAHLPFVRHPELHTADEERWLFEAIGESYIPLLRMLQRLLADGIKPRVTLSVSPTLCAMLGDELLRERCVHYLEQRIKLAEDLFANGSPRTAPRALCQFYHSFYSEALRTFTDDWQRDLLGQIRYLHEREAIELIASAGSHAILPIHQTSARAQIAIGLDVFRQTFATDPLGFWLPECAFAPGLEKLLAQQNIRWFVLEAHALTEARPAARGGVFGPSFTHAGPAVFARDPDSSRQIWDGRNGYPGDFSYRDFYRDAGFDLRDSLPAEEHGKFTGLKLHRVTGAPGELKQFYDPVRAESTARRHAQHFVNQQISRLGAPGHEGGIVVAPFDAELFGHWWFEGPLFLEEVIRQAQVKADNIALLSPGDFLSRYPAHQIVQPSASSWGDGGFLNVWLNDKCSWIYPNLHAASARMCDLVSRFVDDASGEQTRYLRQLARELLLAQASDWPFLISNGTARDYAMRRVQEHVGNFTRLAHALEHGRGNLDFLAQCEARDNLFPDVDWRHFLLPHSP